MTINLQPSLSDEQAKRFVVDTSPWMSCDECFDHLDEYVELPEATTTEWLPAMSAHLTGCQACREEVESLVILIDSDS